MNQDDPEIQKQRIERLVNELDPSLKVEFYPNPIDPSSCDIRFRIRNTTSQEIVASIKADYEWLSSEVADLSDHTLLEKIKLQIKKVTATSSPLVIATTAPIAGFELAK